MECQLVTFAEEIRRVTAQKVLVTQGFDKLIAARTDEGFYELPIEGELDLELEVALKHLGFEVIEGLNGKITIVRWG